MTVDRSEIQEELEAANSRLKTMALELKRSNEELEEFARIASHDLSAPIISTRWLVDLLRTRHSSGLDDEGKKCLEQVSRGLERMANLVEAVLAHATVGLDPVGDTHAADAGEAVKISLENLHKHVELSGAEVTWNSLPSLYVNAQALARLFQNLLSNAIKYRSPRLPPRIHISAARQPPMWLICVEDNGIGIEPEWHERIFQPMQRRHGLEIAGSGIGLATCKKIVNRAGGEIWVDSQLGSGASFFFTLPGPEHTPERRQDP